MTVPDPNQSAGTPTAGEGSSPTAGGDSSQGDGLELARKVAERVWQLWQEELRHERERAGYGR